MNMAGLPTLWRFFALSLAMHVLALLLLYPMRSALAPRQEIIPISLLPAPDKLERTAPSRVPRTPATRPSKVPSIIAKRDSPIAPEKSSARTTTAPAQESRAEPSPTSPPPPREPIPEQSIVAERQLPTLKDLLPSATWSSSSSRSSEPISLNTRDPIYVTYFNKLKQLIESQWEYPELALRYGLQGTLALEFMIGSSGQLERLRLIRSSGSEVLDEEALRAIKAAAPFPPIPPWIKPNPLLISASMEYHDNRLNYRFAR
jgi:TonB family protein